MTRIVNLTSGVRQRVEMPGEHPLTRRLVPDITIGDGDSLRGRFTPGRFVLMDRTPGSVLLAAAAAWEDRVVTVSDTAASEPGALLVRPTA